MSDPKNPKNPPPDDFSKTTPYIRDKKQDSAPEQSSDYTSDWEKTNYIYSSPSRQEPPKSSGDDEWSKTAVNINLPRQNQGQDFDKTFMPGQGSSQPAQSDWDETSGNFNINQNDFGDAPRRENDFSATTPYVQLPESERAKLRGQEPPPEEPQFTPGVPTEKMVESKKSGGVPPWAWFAGVAGLFLLLAATIVISYLLFSKRYGYDVVVKGTEPHSETFVDGTRWGYTTGSGDILLAGLRAAEHKIEIKHPNFTYETETVSGNNGDPAKEVVVRKKPKATVEPPKDDCANVKKGEFAKAAKCANDALDKLGDNFTVEQLLAAMNLYIINFDSGKYNIKPNDMQFLQKAAGYMKKLPPNVKIEVGGHTDNVGSAASNQKLSENRANAVRNALIGLGVKQEMLEMRGYGATRPRPGNTNANEDEKFQNRRIQYTALIG